MHLSRCSALALDLKSRAAQAFGGGLRDFKAPVDRDDGETRVVKVQVGLTPDLHLLFT